MVDFARCTPFSIRVSQIPNRFSLPQDFLATIPTPRPRRRKICLQRQTSLNIFGSNVDSTADLTIHKKCHGASKSYDGCCLAFGATFHQQAVHYFVEWPSLAYVPKLSRTFHLSSRCIEGLLSTGSTTKEDTKRHATLVEESTFDLQNLSRRQSHSGDNDSDEIKTSTYSMTGK